MSLLAQANSYTPLSDEQVGSVADIINDTSWDELQALASTLEDRISMGRQVARTYLKGEDGADISPSDKFRIGCMVAANHGL